MRTIFSYYAGLVYAGQEKLGEINVERLSSLQDLYLAKGIMQRKSLLEEHYTNQFVK